MTQWINRASSTMVKRYFLRSCYNAFSELQLQSRLPGASQYRSCFATCSRANAFCHSRLQPRIAGASHQIDQRSRSPGNGDDSALRRFFFCDFYMKSSSRYSLVHILPTSSSKSVPASWIFFTFWSANQALATALCTFCRQLPQSEARNRGNKLLWRFQEPFYPKKRWVSHPRVFFTRECTRFRTVTRPKWLTWWCGWHDAGNANHDDRP